MQSMVELTDNELVEALEVKPKARAKKKSLDEEALEVAELAQAIASEAASEAVKGALKEGLKLKQEALELIEKQIADISSKYAKPRDLLLHVKIGNLDKVKLKSRACAVLPDLIAQAKIGQAGGNWPLMVGPTGCGKTVAAEQLADSLKLPFYHINFTEGASETWLWGRQTANGFVPGQFWLAYSNGGVFLGDELDACNDNVLLSLNTSLANGKATNPINGESVKKHENFVFVAAANTNGKGGIGAYSGRTKLDGATLNRFTMFSVGYDKDLEAELCPDTKLLKQLHSIREKLEAKQAHDVISTRDIKNAYMQLTAGFTVERILSSLKLRMDKSNHELFEGKK